MREKDFQDDAPGDLVTTVQQSLAFVPHPPPTAVNLSAEVNLALERANVALGRLDQLGRSLVNPYLLIQPFTRREAVASSRMEGTTADLGQLVLFEVDGQAQSGSDVREVANYVRAADYGLKRPDERPVTLGLIREMHHILLDGVRGRQDQLGEFREVQNWISGPDRSISSARYVPPPPDQVLGLMRGLESYWQSFDGLPSLVRLAVIHYQFETIHPFVDGNGRLGRLLMTVLLDDWGVLTHPLLYLSAAIEGERHVYHDGLLAVSQRGAWDDWIAFFLRAVAVSAEDALDRGNRLVDLLKGYEKTYRGRSPTLANLTEQLFETPAFTVSEMAERLGIWFGTAQSAVERLVSDGVLREATGQQRNRVYVAAEILAVVDAAQEPH